MPPPHAMKAAVNYRGTVILIAVAEERAQTPAKKEPKGFQFIPGTRRDENSLRNLEKFFLRMPS